MNRRKKHKEIFWAGFFVTLVLAGTMFGIIWVDYSLSAAGFAGGGLARGVESAWNQLGIWLKTAFEAGKNLGQTIVNFLKHFLQEIGNLLHCAASML